ncbi:permease-like cell division protein FtsX [Micromonospora zamorensis]|uniref:permease-like cell division protein FtsX n=1 Tax=Micromonospora zamorensis TaxID=709883 RepID=UPI003CF99077
MTVFLGNDVTAAQKGSVEQQLRSMPSVREVSLETREQAYERQKADLRDQPDLLAGLQPECMPELLVEGNPGKGVYVAEPMQSS